MTDEDDQDGGVAFVTGAGGFLGGAAAAALQGAGWRVAAMGHGALPAAALRIEGDIGPGTLAEALRELGRPRLVFHAAGGASVGASLADPEGDFRRTVGSLEATLAFLQGAAAEARLIYPSSAAVYGARARGPIPESAALDPISPYGRHKQMAEVRIAAAAAGWGLDAVVVRFFSIYGPGLHKQLLWELARRAAAGPESIELSGHGDEARDFLFVDDAVRLVLRLAGLERGAAPGVVNGGAGRAVTVRRLAEALCSALGAPTRIGFNGQVREGDPESLVADPALARALGFEPEVSLEDGLQRFAAWFAGAGP